MASPSTVITRGFGTFGSVHLLPTRGYGIGSGPSVPPPLVTYTLDFLQTQGATLDYPLTLTVSADYPQTQSGNLREAP